MLEEEIASPKVLINTVQFSDYTLYFTGPITSPSDYMEHFAALKSASSGDRVVLQINSPGGDLATATMIINHIRDCQAEVVGVIGMECASSAGAIALACDSIIVDYASTFMAHSFSYHVGGNAGSVHNHADFNKRLNEKWVRATYANFLPEEKIDDILRGVDVLLDSDQIVEYWENRERKRKEDLG